MGVSFIPSVRSGVDGDSLTHWSQTQFLWPLWPSMNWVWHHWLHSSFLWQVCDVLTGERSFCHSLEWRGCRSLSVGLPGRQTSPHPRGAEGNLRECHSGTCHRFHGSRNHSRNTWGGEDLPGFTQITISDFPEHSQKVSFCQGRVFLSCFLVCRVLF